MEQLHPLETSSWWRNPESVATANDYAILNGLLFGRRDGEGCTNVSVSLQPAKFPRELFQKAVSNQEAVNTIVDLLSTDYEFLASAFKDIIANDEFVRRLFEIHQELCKSNKQTTVFGLHRTDYLINAVQDTPSLGILQVEINTIAAGCDGLQSKMNNFHEFIQQRFDSDETYNLPENNCLQGLTDGIYCAWKEYGNKSAVVLFVVISNEKNIFDHRLKEFKLWQSYGVPTIRRTLSQLSTDAQLGPNNELIVSGGEVAVVYYRSGYDPSDYPSEKEWSARRVMELSRASCCPSVSYQLVGFKKIQDIIAQPGVLERYLSDQATAASVRSTFAGFHSLDKGPEGDSVVQKAMADPHKYVFKPQREGGGNNAYGDDIRQLLGGVASDDVRQTHILMDMINSPVQGGVLLTMGSNTATETDIITELGIFGVFVRKGDTVLMNNSSGYLLRSKPASVNEGGVSVGVASLNTVELVSKEEYLKCVQS